MSARRPSPGQRRQRRNGIDPARPQLRAVHMADLADTGTDTGVGAQGEGSDGLGVGSFDEHAGALGIEARDHGAFDAAEEDGEAFEADDVEEVPEDPASALTAEPPEDVLPPRPEPKDGTALDGPRQPILSDAMRHPAGWAASRAEYLAHAAAFQGVRLPKYLGQAALWAPRGHARLLHGAARYVLDLDSGELQREAKKKRDPQEYLMLRADSRKERWPRMAAGAGIAAVYGVAAYAGLGVEPVPVELQASALAGLLGAGWWFGKPLDRPPYDSPTADNPRARRITSEMVVRVLVQGGLYVPRKGDRPAEYPEVVGLGIGRDGPGWGGVVDMPGTITADAVVAKSKNIAAGLRVDESRLFIDPVRGRSGHAGRVKVWVADNALADMGFQPNPVLKEKSWSLWKGVPFGIDERGRPVTLHLVWSSLLIGSKPRMGKTTTVQEVALAVAKDPYARLKTADFKGGRDLMELEKVAHFATAGVRDYSIKAFLRELRSDVEDMNRRFEKLRSLPSSECPDSKVTPDICRRQDMDMPLTVWVIDEAQRALEHKKHGEEILELLIDLAKTGPAVGIIPVLSTQRPGTNTFPEDLRGQLGARFCLYVKTWQTSDMILGAGSAKAGWDASKRLTMDDLGVGILDAGSDDGEMAKHGTRLVRTYYMDQRVLEDQAAQCHALRTKEGTLSGFAAGETPEEPVPDRFLEHVYNAFDPAEDDVVWSETLLERLAKAYPDIYDGYDPTLFAKALASDDIKTKAKAGQIDGKRYTRRGPSRQAIKAVLDRKATARRNRLGAAPPEDDSDEPHR